MKPHPHCGLVRMVPIVAPSAKNRTPEGWTPTVWEKKIGRIYCWVEEVNESDPKYTWNLSGENVDEDGVALTFADACEAAETAAARHSSRTKKGRRA
jgi:hypothetical protein